MTSTSSNTPARRQDGHKPADHHNRDVLDVIDETVARITDADIDEHLRRVLERAGYYRARDASSWLRQPGDVAAAPVIPAGRLAAPAIVQPQQASRVADDAVATSQSLTASGRDLRVMSPASGAETRAELLQLRELLRRCPAGVFGTDGSAMVLSKIAATAENLIVDRDERTALRLIDAVYPHQVFLGRHHPAVFGTRRARAEALCELGHYQRAATLLRRLSEDEKRIFGSDDPQTALLLLWALISCGQLQEADLGFRALAERLIQPHGHTSLMLWHLQCRYSWLLCQQGLDDEAARSYNSVIINRSHELGADHPETLDARHSKGKGLVAGGDGPQAVTLLEPLADDRARVQGDRHPDTLETLKYLHLARVRAEPRDDRVLARAISSLEQILRVQIERHGPAYPMSRDTAIQLRSLFQVREATRAREPIPDLRQVPDRSPSSGVLTPLQGK